MENVTKAILITAAVIVTLFVIAGGFRILKPASQSADSANAEVSAMNQTMSESKFTIYESSNLLGSQVQTAITTFDGEYVAIQYEAADNSKQHVNYSATPTTSTILSSDPMDNTTILQGMNKKTSPCYINPNQSYTGKIVRSDQGIVGIIFTKN